MFERHTITSVKLHGFLIMLSIMYFRHPVTSVWLRNCKELELELTWRLEGSGSWREFGLQDHDVPVCVFSSPRFITLNLYQEAGWYSESWSIQSQVHTIAQPSFHTGLFSLFEHWYFYSTVSICLGYASYFTFDAFSYEIE